MRLRKVWGGVFRRLAHSAIDGISEMSHCSLKFWFGRCFSCASRVFSVFIHDPTQRASISAAPPLPENIVFFI